jgi:hypothetical protein
MEDYTISINDEEGEKAAGMRVGKGNKKIKELSTI